MKSKFALVLVLFLFCGHFVALAQNVVSSGIAESPIDVQSNVVDLTGVWTIVDVSAPQSTDKSVDMWIQYQNSQKPISVSSDRVITFPEGVAAKPAVYTSTADELTFHWYVEPVATVHQTLATNPDHLSATLTHNGLTRYNYTLAGNKLTLWQDYPNYHVHVVLTRN
jgi:hypothetical protein